MFTAGVSSIYRSAKYTLDVHPMVKTMLIEDVYHPSYHKTTKSRTKSTHKSEHVKGGETALGSSQDVAHQETRWLEPC